MMLWMLCLIPAGARGESSELFRVGFSKSTFGEVNENDAIAAVRVWSQALVKERGIAADPQPIIFHSDTEMAEALTSKSVDCINLTTAEYEELRGQVAKDCIVVGVLSESITEEYLLIVHRKSGIEKLSDLRGRTLGFLESPRTSLAHAWADTLMVREGLPPVAELLGRIFSETKIGKVILPVFFRQKDACVVTRKGFDTMIELNPQTGQELKVLATSPPVVPMVFCFRNDFSLSFREKIMGEITTWHLSSPGRQILTLFQTDKIEKQPVSCLDSAFEILTAHKKLSGKARTGQGVNPSENALAGKR
ncbi:MAG: phosphate/phosphite/phosphonate ABC transporter substrate-binding protein [Proteobacteria bacterium]|nr:phosphate/phosphite/phosphonate ABC transporter substrate-binding protein [Pseudomonadota bacterium]MBU4469986.1 phosphate/phosphite/phosphonate ABC transporter substrate-binding protein [Pseudomonadota bacterium]MCG2753749.1 phosphate/phosphite/phosphonate ABC transporter substrate-binding protein [Desulfobacteraceae bacterium]